MSAGKTIAMFDAVREVLPFQMAAHLPAVFIGLRGIATFAKGRIVRFTGEVKATPDEARFSLNFAGRFRGACLGRPYALCWVARQCLMIRMTAPRDQTHPAR